ncbi:MAG: AAA family ATPase [Candidatus Omnitrophica bacterium]|nr:AAA family ATPase [Candidatus Omnitrophota bacterium]
MNQYDITLADYWRIIRKRKWIIGIIFCIVFVSTVVFTSMQIPRYEASAKIRIELPLDNKSELALWYEAPNLSAEVQVIKSLPVLEKVVEKLEKLPVDEEARKKAIYEYALQYQDKVEVKQQEDTDIVTITAADTIPKKAAQMANTIAEVFLEEGVQGRRRRETIVLQYINKQLEKLKEKIEQDQSALQTLEQEERIFIVAPENKTVLDRMTLQRATTFESEMLGIQIAIEELKSTLNAARENTIVKRLSENFIFVGLRRSLMELEFENYLLLIDYTEKHPLVLQKREEIITAKDKMIAMIRDISALLFDDTMEQEISLVFDHMFLKTKLEVLYRIVNKSYADSGSLSANQLKYFELKRAIDSSIATHERFLKKEEEIKLSVVKDITTIILVSPARPPADPIKPQKRLNYLIGCIIGLLLGMLTGFMAENADMSIGTIEEVEKNLDLLILGIIPRIKVKKDAQNGKKQVKVTMHQAQLISIFSPLAHATESFKALRIHLLQLMKKTNKRIILFTSSIQEEGKSTIIANLAVSMAQLGKKTVLIGANLRRPTLYKLFGISKTPGLTDILIGKVSWEDAMKTPTDIVMGELAIDKLLQTPWIHNLSIITSGDKVSNPSEMLGSTQMDILFANLRKNFDVILVDCSPTLPVPDAITLGNKVDGVVLVYRVGRTGKDVLKRTQVQLTNVDAHICGVVLNDVKTEVQLGPSAYYYQYQYGS